MNSPRALNYGIYIHRRKNAVRGAGKKINQSSRKMNVFKGSLEFEN